MNFLAGMLLVFAPPGFFEFYYLDVFTFLFDSNRTVILCSTNVEAAFWLLDHIVKTLLPFSFNDQLV